jgi:hypothetical protein
MIWLLGLASAWVLALLEIQIEGENGWAAKLPTWRWKASWFKWIPGGNKEVTGYHIYLWIFISILAHLMLVGQQWSISKELVVVAWIVAVLRLEDFLWFIVNPAYGWKNFKKEKVAWHKQWWGPFPILYYCSILLVGGLLFLARILV